MWFSGTVSVLPCCLPFRNVASGDLDIFDISDPLFPTWDKKPAGINSHTIEVQRSENFELAPGLPVCEWPPIDRPHLATDSHNLYTTLCSHSSSTMTNISSDQSDFDFWEFVSCAKCQLSFSLDAGATVPFWLTQCGHVICNNHLSLHCSKTPHSHSF
jgi:hypothetical protein